MRWLLALALLPGCVHDNSGVRLGDRVRFTEGFLEGCIGVAVDTLWEDDPIFNTTCFVQLNKQPPFYIEYTDCYKLEVLDNDLQAFVGCPRR